MKGLNDDKKAGAVLKSLGTSLVYNTSLMKNIFIFYSAILIFAVFFTPNRYEGYYKESHIHPIPLGTTLEGLKGPRGQHFLPYWIGYFGNLLGNVVLFMPMGFLLMALTKKKRSTLHIVLIGALISIGIELSQLIFKIGVCDIDDVILNTLGTWCGVEMFKYVKFKVQSLKVREQKASCEL